MILQTSVLNLESFHQQKYLIKYCNMRVLLCMYQTLKLYLKTKKIGNVMRFLKSIAVYNFIQLKIKKKLLHISLATEYL